MDQQQAREAMNKLADSVSKLMHERGLELPEAFKWSFRNSSLYDPERKFEFMIAIGSILRARRQIKKEKKLSQQLELISTHPYPG